MTNVSNYETIQAKDKPVADNFVYVYSEIEDGGFRKVSKEMLKILLGIATKLSELENDKEFVSKAVSDLENYYLKSETYSREELDNKLSLVPRFSVKVVSSLPVENISETTVYLVPAEADENNLYTEYINVNGLWEILGSQKIAKFEVTKEDIELALGYTPADIKKVEGIELDLKDKLSETDLVLAIEEALRQANESGDFDGKDGVGIKSIEKNKTEGLVDTYVITFTNDKKAAFTVTNGKDGITPSIGNNGNWYLGEEDTNVKAQGIDGRGIKSLEKTSSTGNVDTYTMTFTDGTKFTYNVVNASSESGGIVAETDPTVPSWAKQPSKPSYTAEEVGALPNTTKIPSNTSDLNNDNEFITKTVSNLANYYLKSETYSKSEIDAKGYLTEHQDLSDYAKKSEIPKNLSQLNQDSTHRVVTDLQVETWNNKSNFSGDYKDLTNQPTIPSKTSQLTNNSGFITKSVNDLANYYLKSQTYSAEEIDNKISTIPKFSIEVVTSLPTTNISNTTVYLIASGNEQDNLYTEYIYINGKWEYLGKQTVDLSGYVKRTELSSYYTETEIDSLLQTIRNSIPTKLAQMTADATHRTVTDTEKQTWNNKSNFSGAFKDLTGKPTTLSGYGITDGATKEEVGRLEETIADQFDYAKYGLPVLKLTGDITGMSKDVKKTLNYVYGDKTGSCTLKWQGSSSLSYEKKNYTIEFDNPFEAKENWSSQKKYCLKANFIDHSHSRNIVSAKLWGKIVKSRSNVDARLNALVNGGAVDGFPVVIELNGKFHGLYTFNIPKEAWLFGMDGTGQQAILCAESPSDTTTGASFNALAKLDGTDFDLEYSSNGESAWVVTSINRLIQAVMDSNGSDLDTTLAKYIDWDSAIDHYIFTTLIQGEDNIIKNYLLVTYDGVKWFFSEYDMDTTYGLYWTGKRFYANDECHQFRTRTFDKLMNLIWTYKRPQLRARYNELRANIMAEDKVSREFFNFSVGIPRTILDMDVNTHPTIPSSAINNVFQILNNYRMRVLLTDEWIKYTNGELEPPTPIVNILKTAIDTNGNIYNGKGWKENTRLSASSGYAERELAGVYITGYIEVDIGDTLCFENITFGGLDYSLSVYLFDSSMVGLTTSDVTTAWFNPVTDSNGNVTQITIPTSDAFPDIGYVRINASLISDESVITKK